MQDQNVNDYGRCLGGSSEAGAEASDLHTPTARDAARHQIGRKSRFLTITRLHCDIFG
jgi:hypothetical protein